MAELLDQVGMPDRVEQAGLGGRTDGLEVLRVQHIDVALLELGDLAAVVEAPLAEKVDAADHVVPVVASDDGLERLLVTRDKVSLGRQADSDIAGVTSPA